jgi:hypothetical protein
MADYHVASQYLSERLSRARRRSSASAPASVSDFNTSLLILSRQSGRLRSPRQTALRGLAGASWNTGLPNRGPVDESETEILQALHGAIPERAGSQD